MNVFPAIVFVLLSSIFSVAYADNRVRTEIYKEGEIYQIISRVGYQTTIQLEEGERFDNSDSSIIGMGDSEAWELGARGHNVSFKPTEDYPQTNLTLITNKRTYLFSLRLAKKNEEATWFLKFRYPETEAAKAAAEAEELAKKKAVTEAARAKRVVVNTNYFWRGTNDLLAPSAAFDDGRFTRLIYDHAGELPVFYKVLPDGSESLINTNIDQEDNSIVVLHEVIRKIRARLNNEVIEISNGNYIRPMLDEFGTSVHGAVRKEKE